MRLSLATGKRPITLGENLVILIALPDFSFWPQAGQPLLRREKPRSDIRSASDRVFRDPEADTQGRYAFSGTRTSVQVRYRLAVLACPDLTLDYLCRLVSECDVESTLTPRSDSSGHSPRCWWQVVAWLRSC